MSREASTGLRHSAEGTASLSASAPRDRRDGGGTQSLLPAQPAKMEALRAPLKVGPCGLTGQGRPRVPERRPPPPSTVLAFASDGPLSAQSPRGAASPPAVSFSFVPRPPRRLGRTHGVAIPGLRGRRSGAGASCPALAAVGWMTTMELGKWMDKLDFSVPPLSHHCLQINRRVMLLNLKHDDNECEVCNEVNNPGRSH